MLLLGQRILYSAAMSAAPRLAPPLLQVSPLIEIQTETELVAALSEVPPLGVSLVMLSVRGDARAAKVRRHLVEKCADNDALLRVTWECKEDATADALRSLGATASTQTPFCVCFDAQGERVLNFVAGTPSALFYGLEDVAGLLDAMEQEGAPSVETPNGGSGSSSDGSSSSSSSSSDGGDGNGGDGGDGGVSAERVDALEAECQELRMEVSVQRAELFSASTTLEALLGRVDALVSRVEVLEAREEAREEASDEARKRARAEAAEVAEVEEWDEGLAAEIAELEQAESAAREMAAREDLARLVLEEIRSETAQAEEGVE